MNTKVEDALQALLDSGQPFSLDDLRACAIAAGGNPWNGTRALEDWQNRRLVRPANPVGIRSRKTYWKKGTPR